MKRILQIFLLIAAGLSMMGFECPTWPETVTLEIPVLGSKEAPIHWTGTQSNDWLGAYVDYTTLNTEDLIANLEDKVEGEIENIQSVNIQSVSFEITECSIPLTTTIFFEGFIALPPNWTSSSTHRLFYIANNEWANEEIKDIGEVKLNTSYVIPLEEDGVSMINQELQRAGLESTSFNCIWLMVPKNYLGTIDVTAFATLKIQFVVNKKVG